MSARYIVAYIDMPCNGLDRAGLQSYYEICTDLHVVVIQASHARSGSEGAIVSWFMFIALFTLFACSIVMSQYHPNRMDATLVRTCRKAGAELQKMNSLPLGSYLIEETPCMPRPVKPHIIVVYDSVLTRALPFVTFTPSCFARAMMSMRFRAETE